MDLRFSDMMQMQQDLHQRHKGKWEPLTPDFGKVSMLYMVEELGEVVAIVKKKGDHAVVEDPDVRQAFLEEMADVMMYYTDTLLRYNVSAEEISNAYASKHDYNKQRDYTKEYEDKYHG